ncbi:hypothetical protein [Rhabdaerophilum sp. SD176]|uniref:hypothetical protein n=1 Tax=Rhabdaerophilum sp. SD176 TaxID=2983548 RepID=UPI0024DF9AAE|nr:hypothetical protein [Rhabdaerophilum sp. SD176]
MSSMIVQPPDHEHAYEQIEAAVMETARGRWFLQEYARRNRQADTVMVLGAIERLQRHLIDTPALPAPAPVVHAAQPLPYERLQGDIIEMARAIARAEREIRQIRHDGVTATQYSSASDELDAVVATTEKATSSILSAAERIQEYAWTKREQQSGDLADCDMLDSCATEIYTACGFQDLTAQRIRKVVDALRFLDERLKSILEATGLAEDFQADEKMIEELDAPPPTVRSSDIWMSDANQAEIDDTFDFFEPAASTEPTMVGAHLLDIEAESLPAPVASAAPMPAPELERDAYASLSTEERIRAFR